MRDVHHRNTRNIFALGLRIGVSDIERSHRWYKDVLGFHMEMADDGLSSVHQIELVDGSVIPVFWLVPAKDHAIGTGGISLVCHVGQLGPIIDDLRAAGVTIASEPVLRPGTAVPSAVILDPDGHQIVLVGN
ncbi:MAG: hypothetical protein Kow0074_00980 [Candidatus Zixiibacteriota bacterium]